MNNLKRGFIAVLVIATILVNGSVECARAEKDESFENSSVVRTIFERNGERVVTEEFILESRVLFEQGGQTRANEAPSQEYDLSDRVYHYQFSGVDNFTYTRYYFKPHADGHLILSVDNWNSGGAAVKIELYEKGWFFLPDTLISTWTGDPATILGLGYSSLDPDKAYYFKFLPYMAESISGEGDIKY